MKFRNARALMRTSPGFRVEFEKQNGGILTSDHFPDDDEEPIGTEEEAWGYAERFAEACKNKGVVNVYVIHGDSYIPVKGYKGKELNILP